MYVLSSDLPEKLLLAMRNELEVRYCCEKLLGYMNDDQYADVVLCIIEEERDHYSMLHNLYIDLTGRKPVVEVERNTDLESFDEVLEKAIAYKKCIYESYRNIHISTKSPYIKRIFMEMARGEEEHAAKLCLMHSWLNTR